MKFLWTILFHFSSCFIKCIFPCIYGLFGTFHSSFRSVFVHHVPFKCHKICHKNCHNEKSYHLVKTTAFWFYPISRFLRSCSFPCNICKTCSFRCHLKNHFHDFCSLRIYFQPSIFSFFIAISGIYRKACTISRSCLQCWWNFLNRIKLFFLQIFLYYIIHTWNQIHSTVKSK